MTITSRANSFIINIASSKKKFPVAKVNYPSLKGNFPKVLAYGVFTGQLHRFARTCTLTYDFINNAMSMGRLLMTKGYKRRKLVQYFDAFIRDKYPDSNMPKAYMHNRFKRSLRSDDYQLPN